MANQGKILLESKLVSLENFYKEGEYYQNLFQHYITQLGQPERIFKIDKLPFTNQQPIFVLEIAPPPDEIRWTYLTLGLSLFPMQASTSTRGKQERRVEFIVYSQDPFEQLTEFLMNLTVYCFNKETFLDVGHTIDGFATGIVPTSPLTAAIVLFPFMEAPAFNSFHYLDGSHISFLWILPVSSAEGQIFKQKGLKSFVDDIFFEDPEKFLDLHRDTTNLAETLVSQVSSNEARIKQFLAQDKDTKLKLMQTLATPTAQELILLEAALKDIEPEVRFQAANILGQTGNQAVVTPLIEVLQDIDSQVRLAAVEALRQLGSAKAIIPLIKLLRDAEATIREWVTLSLIFLKAREALEPILALRTDSSEIVRRNVAMAIGSFDSKENMPILRAMLNDQSSSVKRGAAYALLKFGDKQGLNTFLEALESEDPEVRIEAVITLGETGQREALAKLEWLKEHDTVEVKDTKISDAAAEAIFRIRNFKE
jgi:HEAT repeat protein